MNTMIQLSLRLETIARMVSKGKIACDVGCDHGFVSIYLVQHQICPSVLAMDVRKGPLGQARLHVEEAGLETKVRLRLSDGLENYQEGEAQCLILAGMGGRLMTRILKNPKAETFDELILSPQSEIYDFRLFLKNMGWVIVDENMIYEEGKYYPIVKAIPFKSQSSLWENERESIPEELEFRFGKLLLQRKNRILLQFLKQEEEKLEALCQCLSVQENERRIQRKKELELELGYVREAMEFF